MNIKQLRQFVSISQTGNISRSAEELFISQPALTRSVKNLEHELGVPLIEREARGVSLTIFGNCLVDFAVTMLNDADRLKVELDALNTGKSGRLTLGVGPAFVAHKLPQLLNHFYTSQPDLTSSCDLRIHEGFVEELGNSLRNGKVDVLISLFPESFVRSDLNFHKLFEVHSMVVARSEHPLAKLKAVNRDQLAEFPWALADQKYVSDTFYDFFVGINLPAAVSRIRANSMQIIKAMVLDSNYLTILPVEMIERELENGSLVTINSQVKPLVAIGGIAYRSDSYRTALLTNFIQETLTFFDQTNDSGPPDLG